MTTKVYKHRDTSKNYMLRVRIDNDTLTKLDNCVDKTRSSRSEVVRSGIDKVNDEINKK